MYRVIDNGTRIFESNNMYTCMGFAVKVNRFYRFKYYLKTYGIRKTIIKVFQKMKYKLLGGKKWNN